MRTEGFKGVLLSISIIFPLMASAILLSAGPASAQWPDYIIVQGSDTSYSQDKYPPAPSKPYEPGDMPPIMAAKKVEPAGAVVAAGFGRTCNGGVTYANQRWESGELDILLDKAFQWMNPGATKVLWYGDYGVPGYEYAFNDANNCSWLIDALEAQGYEVDDTDDGTFTPITSSLLDPYDILVIPGLQLGDGSPDGGNPDLLPDDVVTTITDFVKTPPGKGLFLMESGDYDGYCFHRVQNKILEALEFGVFYQHDTVGDPETADHEDLKYVEVDVTTNQFGSDYREATGKTTIRLYKVPSLSVSGPGVVVEITPEYQASTPGSTLAFSVTVTNTDSVEDSYLLTVSDSAGWELALADETLMDVPGPGKSKRTTLTVTIPSGAAIGAEDNIRVKADSVIKTGVSDTGNCIVRAAMQIIPPIDDTQVVEGSPGTNYGDRAFMYMGSSTTGAYLDERVLLKFDLTGIPSVIPPGDWVAADLDARLHVYCFTMSGALGKDVKVRSVDNDSWDEAEITWSDHPAYGDILDTRAVTEVGWYSWGVTSHVQNQFTGDKIASFCMTAESEDLGYPDNFSYGFNTKEADLKFWPYLEFILPYDVDVSIKPWIQDSSPGGTLTYTLIVTNEGSETDSYSLSVTDTQGWGPVIAQNLFTNVQHGESRTTTLTVTIPSDASPCTKDTMTITATSQADSTVSDSANCIAHAFEGVKLSPTDDAHVSSGNVHANYGGEDTLYLRSDTVDFKNERIFLKFDLSTVPSGSTITEAEVWLWSQKAEFADINAQCWSVTDDIFVDEDTVTWGTQPELVELLDTVALKYLPPSEDMWLLWNATEFVRNEFAGDKTASFGIRAEVEDASGRYRFNSKEWPRENERPYLKISYTPPTELNAFIAATFQQGSDDAIFGVRPDATSGFDYAYDIPEPPPPVTPPYLRTFFYYPVQTPDKLHRSCLAPENLMEWPLRIEYADNIENVTLTWSVENVPSEYNVLLYRGGDLVADMRSKDNYTFEASTGSYDFRIIVGRIVPFTLELTRGWNMISFPVRPENSSPDSIFSSYYVLYKWDAENKCYVLHADSGSFIEPDPDVEVGVGYWAHVLEDENVDLLGVPVNQLTLSLRQGWNLIGPPYGGSSIADPADDPDDSVIPWAFTWNAREKSYSMTQLLEAGKGYWAYALRDCTLTLLPRRLEPAAIKIGFPISTVIEEPWIGVIYTALVRAENELGITFDWSDDIGYADLPAVISEWATEYDIVITDSFGCEEAARIAARDFPDTQFVFGSGLGPVEPNVAVFDDWIHEPAYICGMIAGKLTETNIIGVVGGVPVPEVNRLINAFKAGALETNPDVKMKVVFLGEWFNPPVAKEKALAQIEAGADVMYAERYGVHEAALEKLATEDKVIPLFGNILDQYELAPALVVTGPVWDMWPTVKYVIESHIQRDGESFAMDLAQWSMVAKGGAKLAGWPELHDWETRLHSDIVAKMQAEDIISMVETRWAEIIDGTFRVDIDESIPVSD